MSEEENRKPRHNHKYPNFLIKNWKKDPWSLNENRRVKYDRQRHMGEKSYYDDKLEDDLSIVESYSSNLIIKILNGHRELSDEEWYKLILFIQIQAIRLENICNFINEPDSMFPGNNDFLFGVYSSDVKEEIIKSTRFLVDIFLGNNIDLISQIIIALGLVFWESDEPIFAATDNAVFKEVDIDGKFLFVMLPVSPTFAILVTKNSYFANKAALDNYKMKTGDSHVSNCTPDSILINNYNHNSIIHLPFTMGKPNKIPTYKIDRRFTYSIVNAMMEDSKKLVFYDGPKQEILEGINSTNPGRKITNTYDENPFFPY